MKNTKSSFHEDRVINFSGASSDQSFCNDNTFRLNEVRRRGEPIASFRRLMLVLGNVDAFFPVGIRARHSYELLCPDSITEVNILDFLLYLGSYLHRATELLIVIYSTDLRRPNDYHNAQSAAPGGEEMIFCGVPAQDFP